MQPLRALALVLAAGMVSCRGTAVESGAWLELGPLTTPADSPSAQPQLTATAEGAVLVSWLEKRGEQHRFRLARLPKGAPRWEPPVTIHDGPGYFANWADVPSIATTPDGMIAAHWLQISGSAKYAYDVRIRTSPDGGLTWSEPFTPHRDGTQTEHGFASFFPWANGGLAIAWLDGRELAPARERHDAGGDYGMAGQMTLRAASIDHGSAGEEMLVDSRVCDCCPTTAVRTSRGIVLAYRDRSPEEIRDIYVTRFESGRWTEGAPVSHDNWQIAGCPVNGPSISALDDRVALAWFAAPAEARVSVAFSSDGGVTFESPIRVDGGRPLGRVDVEMLPDGSVIVGWIEQLENGAEFRVRRVFADGRGSDPIAVAALAASRASGYPRMARSGDRLVFAWTGDGGVETAEGRVRVLVP